MRDYYDHYIKPEDLDWKWDFDKKTKTHKLTMTYLPTQQSVSGTVTENRTRGSMIDRKRDLQESLREQLEDLVFGK